MLPACPDCGLRPRYLVDGKWSTFNRIMFERISLDRFSVRPQHRRWCPSEYNKWRNFSLSPR